MKIVGFIWLEEIVEKPEVKHQVMPEEVEQVLTGRRTAWQRTTGDPRTDRPRGLGCPLLSALQDRGGYLFKKSEVGVYAGGAPPAYTPPPSF